MTQAVTPQGFDRDAKLVGAWARRDPANFAEVVTFVLLTIQQNIEGTPGALDNVRALGADSPHLWGQKLPGFKYINRHADRILSECEDLARAGLDAYLVLALTEIPGLGLVKAGFVAQLVWCRVGCLDTHNLRRFGLQASAFRLTKGLKLNTALGKARLYVATCEAQGGARNLWNGWCRYVAALRPAVFPGGADQVSRIHSQAFGLAP